MIKPVILSGGTGSRLWPLSRTDSPKQFMPLHNKKSLFLQSLERVQSRNFSKASIIANYKHKFTIKQIISDAKISVDKVILEPIAKNTAPAICSVACLSDDNEILCIMPSDHYIKNNSEFIKCIKNSSAIAEKGYLVTLGIEANNPSSEYGYISPGKRISKGSFLVNKFIEKPDENFAKILLAEGSFWNAGIFIARAKELTNAFKKYAPSIYKHVSNSVKKSTSEENYIKLDYLTFNKSVSISFDVAILEKSKNVAVCPADPGWSDLGTFYSLSKVKNRIGDVVSVNTKNCYLHSTDKLLAVSDVKDLSIVSTKDAILVTKLNNNTGLKSLYSKLQSKDRAELIDHLHVNRPWGKYENLLITKGYQVKRLTINPGSKISLQKHFRRSEHWVVVQGTATITKGKDVFKLYKNQSTYIPKEEVHRIENKGKSLLIIIEVQNGTYLGEDDIERIDDIYGR